MSQPRAAKNPLRDRIALLSGASILATIFRRLRLRAMLAIAASLGFAYALLLAVAERPTALTKLPRLLDEALPQAGASHPVTAVLLDFRSFDTLLEVAVLLIAVVIAQALHESQADSPDRMGLDNPLLRAVTSLLLPLMLLVATYVLWAGASRPGGAFQAGGVLASAGLALRLSGWRLQWVEVAWRTQTLLVLGLATFTVAAAVPLLLGHGMLNHPPEFASAIILAIELALTVSIALGLLGLFRLAPSQSDGPRFADRRQRSRMTS